MDEVKKPTAADLVEQLYQENIKEYEQLMQQIQAGITMLKNYTPVETQPVQLRVGIASAHVSESAMVELLVNKGYITREEHILSVIKKAKEQVADYKAVLKEFINTDGTDTEIKLV